MVYGLSESCIAINDLMATKNGQMLPLAEMVGF